MRLSVDVTTWAWTVPDLPPTTKLVLLHLADRANSYPHHKAWPTLGGICHDTGVSRATVKRALATLRERELIIPIGYGGKTGQAVVYALAGRWNSRQKRWERRGAHGEPGWVHCEPPVGSQRDPGGLTVSPHQAHGEPHNRQTTVSNRNQPTGAPLGGRAGVGDQPDQYLPPAQLFSDLKRRLST